MFRKQQQQNEDEVKMMFKQKPKNVTKGTMNILKKISKIVSEKTNHSYT